jgi:hypothetical protein
VEGVAVRFADRLLRQGHLSDQALTDLAVSGQHPDHLDRCISCAERAAEIRRWLDQMHDEAVAAADAAFPPERLALQHAQILRRIEQAEEPVRVLEFPRVHAPAISVPARHGVAPAWLGVAAAAGLALGVAGGHIVATQQHADRPTTAQTQPAAEPRVEATTPFQPGATPLFDLDTDRVVPPSLGGLDEYTPVLAQVAYN